MSNVVARAKDLAEKQAPFVPWEHLPRNTQWTRARDLESGTDPNKVKLRFLLPDNIVVGVKCRIFVPCECSRHWLGFTPVGRRTVVLPFDVSLCPLLPEEPAREAAEAGAEEEHDAPWQAAPGACEKTQWCRRGLRHGGNGGCCTRRPNNWGAAAGEKHIVFARPITQKTTF